MIKAISGFISVILHPLLMTTWFIFALTFLTPETIGLDILDNHGKWVMIGIFMLLTFILPMASIVILRITSNISSLTLEERTERLYPLIFTIIYYGATCYFLVVQYKVSAELASILIGVLLTLIIITVITLFWKISVHSAAAWGVAGALLGLNIVMSSEILVYLLSTSILISGAIGSARLYLNAHTPAQVGWGGLLGFLICFFTILIMT